MYFRIDRKKKIFVSTFLQALGFSKSDIVNEIYEKEVFNYDYNQKKWKTKFDPENYKSKNFSEEICDAKSNKIVIKKGEKVNFLKAKKLPEPIRNKPENNKPHHPDHIPLIVFSTPPKYLSTRTGWILFKELINPVRTISTMPPTQNKSETRSQINW